MMRRRNETAGLAILRVRAESALQSKPRSMRVNPHLMVNAKEMLHELQVSKIELEMQNSALLELQHARAEIEAGLARYTDLYDFAPIGYFTLDRAGLLHEVNLTAATMLGVPRSQLIGLRLGSFVPARYQPAFSSFLVAVFEGGERHSCELSLTTAEGLVIFVRIEANADESRQTCRAVLEDISARQRAEQALREAKDELELRVLERTRQLQDANDLLQIEIADHKRTVACLRDSKSALRQLAAHQERIKEEERTRIAREIHDELGGLLGAISTNASVAIRNRERAGLPADHVLEDISALAGSAFDMVRRVINELRPGVLDQVGLWAALEWHVAKVRERTGLKCECVFDTTAYSTELDSDCSAAVFRIVQEALTNVVRHAGASRAIVRVRVQNDSILIEVEDDGRGMQQACSPGRECWGLVGMSERARHFGGELIAVSSRDGKGRSGQVRPGFEERAQDRRRLARAVLDRRCIRLEGTLVTLRLPLPNKNLEVAEPGPAG